MDKMGKPAVERLIGKVHEHWPGDTLIQQAYSFIEKAYAGRMHPIGEPYIQYSLNVSLILAEISSDPATICAGLLYHLLSATSMSLKDIRKAFGDEVAGLVHGVTELGRLEWDVLQEEEEGKKEELRRAEILQKMLLIAINEPKEKGQAVNFQKEEKQTENLRRMLLAMASEDIRALIIELADHLHLMRNLDALAVDEKQRILAKEALKVHAPLADRLGIWQLKWELEDLAFRHLQPDEYKRIADQLAVKRETRERYIANVISVLQEELERVGIRAEIDGRVKHIYSIHRKIERKELAFEQINDLLGVRVIVGTDSDCYSALGILHSIWSPVTSIYDGKAGRDWIVNPKDNLYQSFHTTVDAIDGKQLEVQIRTHKMHEVAEYGVAAHWRYEKSANPQRRFPKRNRPGVSNWRLCERVWLTNLFLLVHFKLGYPRIGSLS